MNHNNQTTITKDLANKKIIVTKEYNKAKREAGDESSREDGAHKISETIALVT